MRKRKENEKTRLFIRVNTAPSFLTPLIYLRAFPHAQFTVTYRTVERFNSFPSNYLSHAASLVPLFLHLLSFFILTRTHTLHYFLSLFLSFTHSVSLSLSLFLSHTFPSTQLRFLALLELFVAGLTIIVGLALQGGLLGLRVLTLLLPVMRCRVHRGGHLERSSDIVYARR